jgi:hypothetical protein
MPDLELAERDRALNRLEELGLETVGEVAAIDGFPHPWRLLVSEWLARGGKRS